jgi:hypothetical protein
MFYLTVIEPKGIRIYGYSENSTYGEWINEGYGVGINNLAHSP